MYVISTIIIIFYVNEKYCILINKSPYPVVTVKSQAALHEIPTKYVHACMLQSSCKEPHTDLPYALAESFCHTENLSVNLSDA